MSENKKENKVTETKVNKDTKNNKNKVEEVKETKPKFEKVSKKEADKANKENKKENKKINDKKNNKKTWISTSVVALFVIVIIAVLTVMIVVSSDPKKALDGLLTNLKEGNFNKAQEYLTGDNKELTSISLDDEAQKLLFEKMAWNIKKVTQEKDKAVIEVEIKNKDFQTVVNNYAKRALNAAKEAIGSGNVNSISETDFQNYFLEELKNEQIPTTTNTKTVNAVKVDDKWKIVSDDGLVSALLPGLEEAINTLS